jgi:hypothetical protein
MQVGLKMLKKFTWSSSNIDSNVTLGVSRDSIPRSSVLITIPYQETSIGKKGNEEIARHASRIISLEKIRI